MRATAIGIALGRRIHLGAVIAMVVVALPARAQIVNVLSSTGEVEGFGLEISTAFGFKTGNTNLVQARLQGTVSYGGDGHALHLLGRARFGTRQPVDKLSNKSFEKDFVHISRVFAHLRYRYSIVDQLAVEAFVQPEADRFRDLGLRIIGGAGPRMVWAPIDAMTIAFGIAYMLESELYNRAIIGSPLNHRLSTYLQFSAEISDALKFSNTTFVQPRIAGDLTVFNVEAKRLCSELSTDILQRRLREWSEETPCDEVEDEVETARFLADLDAYDDDRVLRTSQWRVHSESSLSLKITKYLSLRVTFRLGYNSQTPLQLGDVSLAVGKVGVESIIVRDPVQRAVQRLDTSFDTALVLII